MSEAGSDKQDIVIRLLAYLVAAQHHKLTDKAVTLRSLGLSPVEIARVCATTPKTVSVRLAEAKRVMVTVDLTTNPRKFLEKPKWINLWLTPMDTSTRQAVEVFAQNVANLLRKRYKRLQHAR